MSDDGLIIVPGWSPRVDEQQLTAEAQISANNHRFMAWHQNQIALATAKAYDEGASGFAATLLAALREGAPGSVDEVITAIENLAEGLVDLEDDADDD